MASVMYVNQEPSGPRRRQDKPDRERRSLLRRLRNRRTPDAGRLRDAVRELLRDMRAAEDRPSREGFERQLGDMVAGLDHGTRQAVLEYLQRSGAADPWMSDGREIADPATMLDALDDRAAATTIALALGGTDVNQGAADTPARVRAVRDLIAATEEAVAAAGRDRPRHLGQLDPDDLRETLAGLESAPVSVRLDAAKTYGYARATAEAPEHGFDGLALAVELLPLAAWWGHTWENRERLLAEHAGLAADAAACAIAAGRPERALELLEGGRAVLWRQMLTTRTDREELREVDPRLARRMDRVASALERDLSLPAGRRKALVRRWLRLEVKADTRLRLRWEGLAAEASAAVPGGTFTLPTFGADLAPAAVEGPVVVVNTSRWRSDAVIVRPGGAPPVVVELPELTQTAAGRTAARYAAAWTGRPDDRDRAVDAVLRAMWTSVAEPVVRELGELGLLAPDTDGPPRIWWSATGALATVPIHAACSDGGAVSDAMVPSTTPTLLALRRARDRRDEGSGRTTERDLLHVVVADAPGQEPLPGAARTRSLVAERTGAAQRTTLDGPAATHHAVRSALTTHRAAHFDCHGVHDLQEPARSGLVLHDRTLTVADLVLLRDEQPDFAFLGACRTAFTGDRIPDESVTLASALLYAGCPSVIGTVSPVPDRSTTRVARQLYDDMVVDGRMNPVDGARSLHRATAELRRRAPRNPAAWAPFVHVGI